MRLCIVDVVFNICAAFVGPLVADSRGEIDRTLGIVGLRWSNCRHKNNLRGWLEGGDFSDKMIKGVGLLLEADVDRELRKRIVAKGLDDNYFEISGEYRG